MAILPQDLISINSICQDYGNIYIPAPVLGSITSRQNWPFVPIEFAKRAFGYLSVFGEIPAIYAIPAGSDRPILSIALENEMTLNAGQNSALIPYLSAGLEFIELLIESYGCHLGVSPDLSRVYRTRLSNELNPYVNLHLDLYGTPIHSLIGSIFQRHMRAKQSKISANNRASNYIRTRTWTFIDEPVRVVKWIKPEQLIISLDDLRKSFFLPDRLYDICRETIRLRQTEKVYSPVTIYSLRHKTSVALGVTDMELIYLRRKMNKKPSKSSNKRNAAIDKELADIKDADDLDEYEDINDSPDYLNDITKTHLFEELLTKTIDQVQGKETEKSEKPGKNGRKRRKKKLTAHYLGGRPVVENTLPSPDIFYSLIAGLRLFTMKKIKEGMSNGIQIRGIIDLQSHIGWTLERILNIRISNAMDEPLYVAEPTYYPNLKRLFFNPDKRIGWPKLYKKIAGLKPSDSEYKYFWKMHNTIREPLHALHEIYIPQPLRDVLDACINKSTKNNLPHLFSYQSPAGKSVTFRQEDIKAYLKDASEFFKEKALYGRDIHPNQIKTFFEIAYHHAGLCPEQRYLISGDIQTAYIVSLWYFRTSISNLHGNFTAAYNQVESRIWRDAEEIASDYNLDIVWPDNILYENPEAIGQAYDRANYSLGSWRCARLDIAKKTVEILKNDYVLTVGDRMDKPKNHNVRWSRFFDRKLTEIKV